MSSYVATLIHADMDTVWRHTQEPGLHTRWDLRFATIRYPRPTNSNARRRFQYQSRLPFGLCIAGEGEIVDTRSDAQGVRTSTLRFWSDDPKSLIKHGSGEWQYVPLEQGVRLSTRYQYETRFGIPGRVLNAVFFRPLIAWATAWSFDRLRLWLECGITPEESRRRLLPRAKRCSWYP
jgi:hypothetical protein